jgi:hypothetical protein
MKQIDIAFDNKQIFLDYDPERSFIKRELCRRLAGFDYFLIGHHQFILLLQFPNYEVKTEIKTVAGPMQILVKYKNKISNEEFDFVLNDQLQIIG